MLAAPPSRTLHFAVQELQVSRVHLTRLLESLLVQVGQMVPVRWEHSAALETRESRTKTSQVPVCQALKVVLPVEMGSDSDNGLHMH